MLHINRKSLANFSPVRGVIRYRTDAATACETHRRSPSPVRHHPGFAASSSNKRSRIGSPSQATLYLQHSTLPSGARTLKTKPKTLQHSTLPLGSGTLKDATLYLQYSTLPSGSGTLKAKPKTLQLSTLPLGSGTLKDTPSTLHQSTLPPGSGNTQRSDTCCAARFGDAPRNPAFQRGDPVRSASPRFKKRVGATRSVKHYRSPGTKGGGLADNEDHKNLGGSTSPHRPSIRDALNLRNRKHYRLLGREAREVTRHKKLCLFFETRPTKIRGTPTDYEQQNLRSLISSNTWNQGIETIKVDQ
jgi:hypothetical protein